MYTCTVAHGTVVEHSRVGMFVNLCIVVCLYGEYTYSALQMFAKVKSGKVSYKLADTAEKAKTLVTVGGLSEASAEGRPVLHNVHCLGYIYL